MAIRAGATAGTGDSSSLPKSRKRHRIHHCAPKELSTSRRSLEHRRRDSFWCPVQNYSRMGHTCLKPGVLEEVILANRSCNALGAGPLDIWCTDVRHTAHTIDEQHWRECYEACPNVGSRGFDAKMTMKCRSIS